MKKILIHCLWKMLPFNRYPSVGFRLLVAICLISSYLFLIPPIPQDLRYHQFADSRAMMTIWGLTISNTQNVLSNLGFIVIGITSLIDAIQFNNPTRSIQDSRANRDNKKFALLVYAIGIIGTGLGSAYYHWNPNNETLIWDRLPMSIVFMILLSVFLKNRVRKEYNYLVHPFTLLLTGFVSILWWALYDDLKLYILVQFGPLAGIVYYIFVYDRRQFPGRVLLCRGLLFYGVAKLFELLDYQILTLTFSLVSGHTLKHLFATLASLFIGVYLQKDTNLDY
jgi:hypothetical protein